MRLIKNAYRNRKGSVAIIFGILLVPIIGFVGAAIDYSHAYGARTQLQGALDAATLSAAGPEIRYLSKKSRNDYARKVMKANCGQDSCGRVNNVKILFRNDHIRGVAKSSVPTSFMGIVGFKKMKIAAESRVEIGNKKLELSLVLDLSASMLSGSRLTTMKQVLPKFFDDLYGKQPQNDDIVVSLVPYADNVRWGTSYLNWLHPDPIVSRVNIWQGCFLAEDSNDITTTTAANVGSLIAFEQGYKNFGEYGPQYWCPLFESEVVTFETNSNNLKYAVQRMKTGFATGTDIGLSWGWRLLSPNWRGKFDGDASLPAAYSQDVRKVLVVMTDGMANTSTRYRQPGQPRGPLEWQDVLQNFKDLCQNISDEGKIDLYAIGYEVPNPIFEAALKNCIAGKGSYYEATTGDLGTVFANIAKRINTLYLSK
jgi:hypothetical protein